MVFLVGKTLGEGTKTIGKRLNQHPRSNGKAIFSLSYPLFSLNCSIAAYGTEKKVKHRIIRQDEKFFIESTLLQKLQNDASATFSPPATNLVPYSMIHAYLFPFGEISNIQSSIETERSESTLGLHTNILV